MTYWFTKIREDRRFQSAVISIILLSSLLVGFQTYEESKEYLSVLIFLDYFVTLFFVIELSIRFFSEEKKFYFTSTYVSSRFMYSWFDIYFTSISL